jgi:hypothetical protein
MAAFVNQAINLEMAKRLLRQMLGLDGESDSADHDLQLAAAAVAVHDLSRTAVRRRHGGSVIGRVPILRNTMQGHIRIFNDYFAPNPVYNDEHFRRRYVMLNPMVPSWSNYHHQYCKYFTQYVQPLIFY